MNIKDLKPNPKNPRTITDEKLRMLEKSLKEFGSLDGFIYNQKTKQLVGGHQRLKLIPSNAKVVYQNKLKKPTKTGTIAEGFVLYQGERFPYREVVWSSKKEKAANLAANRGAGEWNSEILGDWFKELDGHFDLDLTMFDADERKAFSELEVKISEKELDENISTEKECPSCGYKW